MAGPASYALVNSCCDDRRRTRDISGLVEPGVQLVARGSLLRAILDAVPGSVSTIANRAFSVSLGDRNRAGDRRARPARERCARGRATGRVGRDPEPARQRHRGGSWRCGKHRGLAWIAAVIAAAVALPRWRTGPGNGAPRGVARCRVTPAAHRTGRPCLLRRCRTHALPGPTSRRIRDGPNRVTQAKARSRRLKPNRALEVGERNPFTFPSPEERASRRRVDPRPLGTWNAAAHVLGRRRGSI